MEDRDIISSLNKAYFSENCHEKEVVTNLKMLLKPGMTFVDVGASLGQYSFYTNKFLRDGTIYAIEPDPIKFKELEKNCNKWKRNSTNKIITLNKAISDKNGILSFFITNSTVSGGLFQHDISQIDPETRNKVRWEEITIESQTLDSIFKESPPDIIKLDVEGSELRVLKGATKILKECKVKFIIEIHNFNDPDGQSSRKEVYDFLESFNYFRDNFFGREIFSYKNNLQYIIIKIKRLIKGFFNLVKNQINAN